MRDRSRAFMRSRLTLWAGGTVLLLLTAICMYLLTGAPGPQVSLAQRPTAGDLTFGSAQARLVIVEYSDFQCEYCAQYTSFLGSLRESYPDQIRFVYRFFPISSHRYAALSARAAYAAFLQHRFWEMHDLLYQGQQEWADSSDPQLYFDAYAQALGLDVERLHRDMAASTTARFIDRQLAEGQRAGVTHTPWFIVNGRVVFPRNVDALRKIVQGAL